MNMPNITRIVLGMALAALLGCDQDNPVAQRLDNVVSALSQKNNDYGARYASEHLRWRVVAGELFSVPVTVQNTGSLPWQVGIERPFNLGFHWLLVDETPLPVEEGRVRLTDQVLPGQQVMLQVVARAPERRGIYTLRVGMVHEGVTWLSDAGVTPLALNMIVE